MKATLAAIINGTNEATKSIYPNGINHKGTRLAYYAVKGFHVYAINKQHAYNIYHECLIEIGA